MTIEKTQTLLQRIWRERASCIVTLLLVLLSTTHLYAAGSDGGQAASSAPDVITFTNGDQLTGKFVREVNGTVTFHSDIAGDINVGWDKIKELHSAMRVSVVQKGILLSRRTAPSQIPSGTLVVTGQQIELQPVNNATIAPIPVANAAYVVDQAALDKQLRGRPSFLQGWNGGATAGATIVQATQKQFTFSSAVGLVRTVPTVSWLDPRYRTAVNYAQSYGKITQPAYTNSSGELVGETSTKSSILHFDAEHDIYFSSRMYVLGMVAFDHNYSQSLDLQQIYGGGIGWTAIKDAKQQLDLKATVQYERQSFFNVVPPAVAQRNLIGSTFGANYNRKLPAGMLFNQQLLYIPAWNEFKAYSVSESNTLSFPAYKNFSFTIGTLDSYLNGPPQTDPPTKRNSFQFLMGVTYNIKSSY